MLKSALIATTLSLAFVATASAGENNPWDIRDRTAYVVMMDGSMRTMDISDKGMGMLTRRAKKVPRGTVLFMHNGQLYMASAASMFDRSSGGALFSR
ncbi:MAG: hypothetical protein JO000_27550 [Alphaproteobacteria bacterium]|nr:hypothetical protein [Alphaproteobacteria bacterium]